MAFVNTIFENMYGDNGKGEKIKEQKRQLEEAQRRSDDERRAAEDCLRKANQEKDQIVSELTKSYDERVDKLEKSAQSREECLRKEKREFEQQQIEKDLETVNAMKSMQNQSFLTIKDLSKQQNEVIKNMDKSFQQRDQRLIQEMNESREKQMAKEMEMQKANSEERNRAREDLAKVQKLGLDAIQSMHEQNADAMKTLSTTHKEIVKQLDEANRDQVKQLRLEANEIRKQQAAKEAEMLNASQEERQAMRAEFNELRLEKEAEVAAMIAEGKRERAAAQDRYTAMREKLANEERRLREQMLDQEKSHSAAVQKMVQTHGLEMRKMQDLRLEDSREYTRKMETLMQKQVEIVAINAHRQMQIFAAHYRAKEHSALANQMNEFRRDFSSVSSVHAQSIQHLTTGIEDDRDISHGLAKGVLLNLQSALDRLEMTRNAVLSALDQNTSLSIDAKQEQKRNMDALSRFLSCYVIDSRLIVGKLSADPVRKISTQELAQFRAAFMSLSSSVDALPLLPVTDTMDNALAIGAPIKGSKTTLGNSDSETLELIMSKNP